MAHVSGKVRKGKGKERAVASPPLVSLLSLLAALLWAGSSIGPSLFLPIPPPLLLPQLPSQSLPLRILLLSLKPAACPFPFAPDASPARTCTLCKNWQALPGQIQQPGKSIASSSSSSPTPSLLILPLKAPFLKCAPSPPLEATS